jgi:glycosyltransferase involved in cell wall biosynthesis
VIARFRLPQLPFLGLWLGCPASSDPEEKVPSDPSPKVGKAISRPPGCVYVLPWDLHHTGGVNQVVINLYREMLLAGEIEPLVLVNISSAFRPIEKVTNGRHTVYLRLWSPWSDRHPILGFLRWILASPVWVVDLLRLCRHHRVVAFNVHFPSLSVFPIALLRFFRLYRGALIISFHGSDLRNARRAGRIERALWRFVFHSATAIVACSKVFAADVSEFSGKAASKVHAVQNGLDINYFLNNVDRATGLPAVLLNREFILTVATWEWQKGLDILLRAFAEAQRTNAGLALVLVGRAGGAESGLRTLAAELGIGNDVLFIESVPHAQVGLYLEHAKVFCLPSRTEAFGIAILEAGAYRLPVVASRVGGIPEIVIDGETGLLVEPDDVKALAAALGRVLFDPDLARDLGERLYRRVAGSFSWRRACEEYRALLPPL